MEAVKGGGWIVFLNALGVAKGEQGVCLAGFAREKMGGYRCFREDLGWKWIVGVVFWLLGVMSMNRLREGRVRRVNLVNLAQPIFVDGGAVGNFMQALWCGGLGLQGYGRGL